MLTPRRHRGVEILDEPGVDPDVRRRSIEDVTRSNRWLGGLRAAERAARDALGDSTQATLVDLGTGLADIPARIAQDRAAHGRALRTIGVDAAPSLLADARRRGRIDHAVCANILALPFRDHSVDVVLASQVLHHFEDADARRVIAEMHRVARTAGVVADLRRSRVAALGFWLVSFPMRFHRVTRHDGVVSVYRGFTGGELRDLVRAATGVTPRVTRWLGYRLTAVWRLRA